MEKRILRINETSSTNSLLAQLAAEGAPSGQVVLARRQSGGRGRRGRSFVSPEGGLYMSYLFRPAGSLSSPGEVTAAAAVAAAQALECVCGISPEIKWVNDLLLRGKKIAGILCEALPDGGCIVGLGINVNSAPDSFPPELSHIAGSILALSGRETDIDTLAGELISRLDCCLGADCLEEYRSRCSTPGKRVLVSLPGSSYEAFALGIADDFSLILRRDNGLIENLGFGEVSIKNS